MFHVDYLEMIIRSTASFLVLLLLARLLGRIQLSQLTFFHYITGITIGSIAADIAGESKTPFFEGLTSLVWWSFLTFLLGYIGLKSSKARVVIDGQPVIVIKEGKILEDTLGKHHLNMDDLSMLLREKNVFSVNEVDTAILEPDGKLTVSLKSAYRPFTKRDQNIITGQPKYIPTELIVDGNILYQNLKEAGISEEWLQFQLNHFQVKVQDSFYVELQEDGTLYIDQRNDGLKE
ncbi:DUF421 domain-containing protein [Rossellomorea aquimaris]|uniref:DUF421 domain-containing protein n=1 Tax=Rossellomorea TaxID=2837508 RepID=UPI001CD6DB0F|nr:DUF421 domain-containing protein [Rossellomorea aquimaris]MCA1058894.1 DUF421 domain-containing protein [Rossellomorea aquimaris]